MVNIQRINYQNLKHNILQKFFKILKWILISIILLIIAIWFLLKLPSVQNWLGQKAAQKLSKDWKTKVQIKKLNFTLFNNANLEGLYIEDEKKDTLLYAGVAQVKITDWFFMKKEADLTYIGLNDFVINTYRNDSIWNYAFIANKFISKKSSSNSSSNLVLSLKYILLQNGTIRQLDKWYGQNQTIELKKLEIDPEKIDFNKKILHIKNIEINTVNYNNFQYKRLKPTDTTNKLIDTGGVTKNWQLFGWDIVIKKINIENSKIATGFALKRPIYNYFDPQNIVFDKINGKIENVKWNSDTITLKLNLATTERSGFTIKKIQSNVIAFPNTVAFDNLSLITNNSNIGNYLSFSFTDFKKDVSDFIHKINMQAKFNNTKISIADIAYFAPTIQQTLKNDININGNSAGTVSNFSIKDANIISGNTSIKGSITMNGLPNINNTYINFNNGSLNTNITDIAQFAPQLKKIKGVQLSTLGQIDFKGNFTGFINDFVTYGTLRTNLGSIVTDINMKLPNNGTPSYAGKIATNSFAIGQLLQNKALGIIGFNGKIDGKGFDIKTIDANINGTTTAFTYNGYTYKNITTVGHLNQKSYTGSIVANDNNFIADLKGYVDFGKTIPKFNLSGIIKKSNFKNLQFTKDDLSYTGQINLDFEGNNISNFDGEIILDNAIIKNGDETLPFSFLTVKSTKTPIGRNLQFSSNEFDGYVNGKFTYDNITNAFRLFLHQYYPNIFDKPKKFDLNQNFDFVLNTKNVEPYWKLVDKDLTGLNNAVLKGQINTNLNEANFDASIPYFALQDYKFGNLQLVGKGSTDSLVISANISSLIIKDSLEFLNSLVNFQTIKNETSFNIKSSSLSTLNDVDVNGKLILYDNGVQINFEPSNFTINNKKWNLEKNGELILRKDVVFANDLTFKHNNEEIIIANEPDPITGLNNLKAKIKNIEINDFMPFLLKSNTFYGKLNGEIEIIDPLGKPIIKTNSSITDFVKDNEPIGKIDLTGNFDIATNEIKYTAKTYNPKYLVDIEGRFNPTDSISEPIYNKIKLKGTDITIIKEYLITVMDSVSGKAYGELEIFGTLDQQFILGNATIDTLAMLVKFTNVKYKSTNAEVNFNPGEINFSGIKITDNQNKEALVKTGKIYHNGFFEKMSFDLDIDSKNIELLNTNRIQNGTFYGKATGDAHIELSGLIDSKLTMLIDVQNPSYADLFLNTSNTSKTLGKAEFIEFKQYGTEMNADKQRINSSFELLMNVVANPNANITVILDEEAGDQISAKGNGDIAIEMIDGDIKMNGGFKVSNGSYSFSRQAWFNKSFELQEGSTINWDGNPTEARINIDANYFAKNVSLNDLPTAISSNFSTLSSDLIVNANLSEFLSKPKITFKIKYPENKPKDPQIENALSLLALDQSELNKQVAFLVLFNRFLNTEIKIGLLGNSINTISGIITTEANTALNKLLSDKFGGNVKANIDFRTYSLGGITSSSDLERASGSLGLNTNLLNNRLVLYISGNVDFGLQLANQNTFALLPNFMLEYKIQPNGTVVATVFHRQSIDLLNANQSNNKRASSGIGIAWRKETNTFSELFRRRKKAK